MASICIDDRFGLRVRFRAPKQSASARHVKRLIASAQHTPFMQFRLSATEPVGTLGAGYVRDRSAAFGPRSASTTAGQADLKAE
jgi:hypothetical protein